MFSEMFRIIFPISNKKRTIFHKTKRNIKEKGNTINSRYIKFKVHPKLLISQVNFLVVEGAPVAQWVKRWPTDLADRVPSPLEADSSQP